MLEDRMVKYRSLLKEFDDMIVKRERGLREARELNDEFWENLGAHKQRMEEQYNKLNSGVVDEELQFELEDADSIYEAARKYISKYK